MTTRLLVPDESLCAGCAQADLYESPLNQCAYCGETRCDSCYGANGCPLECGDNG